MATPANKPGEAKEGFTNRRFKDGDSNWRSFQERIFTADETDKCPTYVHKTPPCQASCPSGEDIRGWLNVVRGVEKPAKGMAMPEYAFRRLTEANPFPSVMGRVCPAPCETGCNRNALEDHVGINSVEQFIGDTALKNKLSFAAPENSTGKKVAVIGGGPAGLAAAYQLRRRGHACTIFEKYPELGGMMRYGIPGYRMPRDVLDGEINRIVGMGVEVRTNVRVGTDVTLEQLEKEFDAILFTLGAQSGRPLPVPGADATNCISGVAFLEAFNEGRLRYVSKKIVVVGGGDTSIDVVSVARRLGYIKSVKNEDLPEHVVLGHTAQDVASAAARDGADVTLTSLMPIDKMNAAKHEIDDALHEGVKILAGLKPLSVVLDGSGRATALRVAKVDPASKDFSTIAGTEFDIPCDLIVSAIGQGGDLKGLESLNNGKGLINADRYYQVPNKPGFFACGDIVRPHLLTTAIGQAAATVDTIDNYLRGKELAKRPKVDVHHFNLLSKLRETGLQPDEFKTEQSGDLRGTSEMNYAIHNYEDRSASEVIQSDELFLGHFPFELRNKREEKVPSANEVIGHFAERIIPLTDDKAVSEAKRCMSCGLCFECDNCVIYCPQTAVKRT
ncbi:MAG: NAD(P)-binding protein, partial [Acidiferrobacterales bacterium]